MTTNQTLTVDRAKARTTPSNKTTTPDVNVPKRACSAFILFSQAERANVKLDHPDAPSADIAKRLGERWKAADADTKAHYTALYAANKVKADEARRVHAAESSLVVEHSDDAGVVVVTTADDEHATESSLVVEHSDDAGVVVTTADDEHVVQCTIAATTDATISTKSETKVPNLAKPKRRKPDDARRDPDVVVAATPDDAHVVQSTIAATTDAMISTKSNAKVPNLVHPKRRNADPNAPKRAGSAFMLFSQAERANVKRDHPDAPSSDIVKRLGERWNAADADTKAHYTALYAANKVKADEARRVHAESSLVVEHSDDVPTTTAPNLANPKRRKADPNAPKRACSAFMLFSQAERANVKRDHPDAPSADIAKRLGERWNAADADTKAHYTALYAANKVKADEARRVHATSVV